ncbi:MAG: helix-turn-helix domain-containing protein [Deltaproteobacteria bacterium]|nr:helix-turn-helix domain-containing protein [Deltaproteobacteria bacterium]MBW2081660.1 helix-turn-helix domain-containing protein [Deltaproteobacteria bacterium]MBW2298855.1 helix-turn-helix domain-containing protein [Deltaproteobacteria bacterium]
MKGIRPRVREAARRFGRFKKDELLNALKVQSYQEAARARQELRGLCKAGEIIRLDKDLYVYRGKERKRTKLDIVWHLVRSHRQFTVAEIERLSGASRPTVAEYIHAFYRLGYIRQDKRARGYWQLVNDPGPETPITSYKSKNLKRSRKAHGKDQQ